MRIALVTPLYWPAIGGVETHVGQLATRLAALGHETDVLTHSHSAELQSSERHSGVLVRRFRPVFQSEHYRFAPALAKFLRNNSAAYDVVHAHNYHALASLVAAVASRAPFIFTPHYHGMSESRLRHMLHRPYRIAGALMMGRARAVISVSASEAALIARHFPAAQEKIALIPNAVDDEAIAAARPLETHGKKVIVAAGRLEEYKRVGDTIRALEHLDPQYVLRVLGDGPMRPQLERLAERLGVAERVEFLGWVDQLDLYRWLRTATVFVTMSEIEATGITALEALSAGARVVASDIPAHRDTAAVAKGQVRLIESGSPAADLAAAIAAPRTDDEVGSPLPTWADSARRTVAIYEAAVTGPAVSVG